MKKQVALLGATGSIGSSSLDVLQRHADQFDLYAVSAHYQWQKLLDICVKYQPKIAVVASDVYDDAVGQFAKLAPTTKLVCGPSALIAIASDEQVDVVIAAIVGGAGLASSYAAAESGKRILLANKESLVMSGELFMSAAKRSGATVLPVDSEHNAIFQSLPDRWRGTPEEGVTKIWLTGSGGPFRDYQGDFSSITPKQAVAHPNWSMGAKISVDSATMMNKGLEFIEACHLFNVSADFVEVLVHPESVVHSMAAYADGSVLAQLGNPDMRTPIAHCLAWPERIDAGVAPLNLAEVGQLRFEKPDYERFECLAIAIEAVKLGGERSIWVNAANEVAVAAFLKGGIRFDQIVILVRQAFNMAGSDIPTTIDKVLSVDAAARLATESMIKAL